MFTKPLQLSTSKTTLALLPLFISTNTAVYGSKCPEQSVTVAIKDPLETNKIGKVTWFYCYECTWNPQLLQWLLQIFLSAPRNVTLTFLVFLLTSIKKNKQTKCCHKNSWQQVWNREGTTKNPLNFRSIQKAYLLTQEEILALLKWMRILPLR